MTIPKKTWEEWDRATRERPRPRLVYTPPPAPDPPSNTKWIVLVAGIFFVWMIWHVLAWTLRGGY